MAYREVNRQLKFIEVGRPLGIHPSILHSRYKLYSVTHGVTGMARGSGNENGKLGKVVRCTGDTYACYRMAES